MFKHNPAMPYAPSTNVHVANASDKQWMDRVFVVSFMGTHVIAYADSFEDAIEAAAEYCVEQGWKGYITSHEDIEKCCDECTLETDGCDCMSYTEAGYYNPSEVGMQVFQMNKDHSASLFFKRYVTQCAGGIHRSERA